MNCKDDGDSTIIPKKIIRQRILSKRKNRGEADIDTLPVKITNSQLTSEDMEKRERRKEQNRKAATKFRNKKKTLTETRQQERTELIRTKTELESHIAKLLKELDMLKATHNKHLMSGCRLGQNPDNSGCYPVTSTVNSETSDFNSKTHGLIPETTDFSPESSAMNFNSSSSGSNLHAVTPDRNPELCLNATPKLNPETTTELQNVVILDLNPNDTVEEITSSDSPQLSHQVEMLHDIIFDSTHSTVNDTKLPVSPHRDETQHSVGCSLDNAFDMPMTIQNQIFMFPQTLQPQSQFSPASVECEESLASLLSMAEDLEPYFSANFQCI